jgi:hypothetical protein
MKNKNTEKDFAVHELVNLITELQEAMNEAKKAMKEYDKCERL